MAVWSMTEMNVSHKDPEAITFMYNAFNMGKLFSSFHPCPDDLISLPCIPEQALTASVMTKKHGAPDWFIWTMKHWGTTMDAGKDAHMRNAIEVINEHEIRMRILTPNSAPTTMLRRWTLLGYNVVAYLGEDGETRPSMYVDGKFFGLPENSYMHFEIDDLYGDPPPKYGDWRKELCMNLRFMRVAMPPSL